MPQPKSQYSLSPDQQDLLLAALNSNRPASQQQNMSTSRKGNSRSNSSNGNTGNMYESPISQAPGSGQLDFGLDDSPYPQLRESPYLDFEGDFDDSYNFDIDAPQMIGDIPTNGESNDKDNNDQDLHKRKSIDGKTDEEEGGGKRREGDDKNPKKPGRKPLTSEPTTKRKAQNRAAQRAFRDRKEQHLRDLETKVESLEKVSESTNHENGLLKAQVERLQVELKEYRKRLSWVANSGGTKGSGFGNGAHAQASQPKPVSTSNDFQFEFPKFGDLPGAAFNSNGSLAKFGQTSTGPNRSTSLGSSSTQKAQQQATNTSMSPKNSAPSYSSTGNSPQVPQTTSPISQQGALNKGDRFDSFGGLFSPSTLEASRNFEYFPQAATTAVTANAPARQSTGGTSTSFGEAPPLYSNSSASNSNSPSGSSDSQRVVSSIGTSPDTNFNSPSGAKLQDFNLNTINEENQSFQNQTFGNNIPSGYDFNWLVQQNGGNFDPVLFGDYREPQEAIVQQDFGTFFNDAFPLPDLGSPLHNFNEVTSPVPVPPKVDLMKQIDAVQNGEVDATKSDEGQAKLITCNKIWDRLQSMEKFRNGEIDVDNLCSELRAKARCSEGGAVVEQKDVEKILQSAK